MISQIIYKMMSNLPTKAIGILIVLFCVVMLAVGQGWLTPEYLAVYEALYLPPEYIDFGGCRMTVASYPSRLTPQELRKRLQNNRGVVAQTEVCRTGWEAREREYCTAHGPANYQEWQMCEGLKANE